MTYEFHLSGKRNVYHLRRFLNKARLIEGKEPTGVQNILRQPGYLRGTKTQGHQSPKFGWFAFLTAIKLIKHSREDPVRVSN